MAIAGFVIAIVALASSITVAIVNFYQINRFQRAYLSQMTALVGRMGELEESVARIGEGGYLLLRMLMEKGLVDEDEMEIAWKAYVEEPRERAMEYDELLREWKERAEKDGVLVESSSKTSH